MYGCMSIACPMHRDGSDFPTARVYSMLMLFYMILIIIHVYICFHFTKNRVFHLLLSLIRVKLYLSVCVKKCLFKVFIYSTIFSYQYKYIIGCWSEQMNILTEDSYYLPFVISSTVLEYQIAMNVLITSMQNYTTVLYALTL